MITVGPVGCLAIWRCFCLCVFDKNVFLIFHSGVMLGNSKGLHSRRLHAAPPPLV